jgi:hypothetical protein
MKKYSVALVNVGERLPLNADLVFLANKLNSMQETFSFEVVASIPSEVLEKPDLGGQWYYFKRLFGIIQIQKREDYPRYDYFVGLTHVRLTEDENSSDDGNRDYFSLSDLEKTSLITLNHNVTAYNSQSKNISQFMAFNILGELLCNITKSYLYHDKVHHCLFDECVDRGNVAHSINRSIICPDCNHLLKIKGVSESLLRDIRLILDWCRRTTGKKSPLYRSVSHPLTSLIIGASIGWTASAFFSSKQYLYIFISTFAFPTFIYIYYVYEYKKELKKA